MDTKQLQFADYKQAQRLGDVGFDWACEYSYIEAGIVYTGGCTNSEHRQGGWKARYTAPTLVVVLKWFRDEKNLYGFIDRSTKKHWYFIVCEADNGKTIYIPEEGNDEFFDAYEAAESALADKLLTFLEKRREQ
jgi:hypothetical protein